MWLLSTDTRRPALSSRLTPDSRAVRWRLLPRGLESEGLAAGLMRCMRSCAARPGHRALRTVRALGTVPRRPEVTSTRSPAVAKRKGDVKREAAPKGGARQYPYCQREWLLAGSCCGAGSSRHVRADRRPTSCHCLPWVQQLCCVFILPHQEVVQRCQHLPPIAMGLQKGRALPALHAGMHPVGRRVRFLRLRLLRVIDRQK